MEWQKLSVPLRPKQSNVCVFLIRQKSKFVYSVLKWLWTKILEENWWYRVAKKRTKACLNLACVVWRFKKHFACERTQQDCNKTMQASLNLDYRKGEFQWRRFTFDKHLCRNICADKATWCPAAFKASLTAFTIVNHKSRFVAHSLTIWSPWDIQGNSDWLKRSDPFFGR